MSNKDCALCGPAFNGTPVLRTFEDQDKHFCCLGCASVYELAHDSGMLDQVLASPQSSRIKLAKSIFTPGETAYFSVKGMWCAGCAVAAERLLRNQPGVKTAEISFCAERGRIHYDPAQVNPTALLKSLDRFGYRIRRLGDAAEQHAERQQEHILLQLITALAFGMQVMNLSLGHLYPLYASQQFNTLEVRHLQYLLWLLTTPVLFYGGSSFMRGAWRALRARTATMDTLVALGTCSAYAYSVYVSLTGNGQVYFDSVTMITAFVMLGRYMETLGCAQARKDIRKLLTLQPDQAWRRAADVWCEVPADSLVPGDTILVKPGQRVPADAEIIEGQATLDETLLTGESLPLNKGAGDAVFAGTLVTDGALSCRVNRLPREGRLAHITQIVQRTLATKPPIQRLADQASAYFTFVILGVSILTLIGWLSTGHGMSQALMAAVAVLVVACPCALGLATPFALNVTLGRTSKAGILIRNLAALESAAVIQRIVFDKTGTLTSGQMSIAVTVVNPDMAMTSAELIRLAAAVEQFSEHPVARAIMSACPTPPAVATEFQTIRGLGASACIPGHDYRRVAVGSLRLLGVDAPPALAAQAKVCAGLGQTIVWLGWNETVAGFISLRDAPNPTARDALRQLQGIGIYPMMLSGDHARTTQAIAAELRLTDYEGDCMPEHKAARIKAWQMAGERVAMVGDGVNDAPPLAQADLSIAMGSGTDVAGETSDVVLTRPDLTLIPWLIAMSRRTRRIIRENLAWAFAYNLFLVPLAAFGVITPVIAAATMAASSLLVIANSLRLRR